MRPEDLFQAIGETEDSLLDENVTPAGHIRASYIVGAVSIAACTALVVGLAVFSGKHPADEMHPSVCYTTGTAAGTAPGSTQPVIISRTVERQTEAESEAAAAPEAETLADVPQSAPPHDSMTDVPTQTEALSVQETDLPPMPAVGVWRSLSMDGYGRLVCRYYVFEGDGNGTTYEQEDGSSAAFKYTIQPDEDGTEEMQLADEDRQNWTAVLSGTEQASLTLSAAGAEAPGEELSFLQGSTEFHFFATGTLCEEARQYYFDNYGTVPPSVGAVCQEDGTVLIHLYEDLETHNSTWAWYTADPLTGEIRDTEENVVIHLPMQTE